MDGRYLIKDVAERSGFSAATLRYYEDIGLLPGPERTPAGYRTYDESVIERLGFIARAKQLGCSLDEIGELLTAWDGGRCGPVQDRLRTLVAEKTTRAQQQIAELMVLATDLQRASRDLERHRPEGPCDESCGCVGDPSFVDTGAAFPTSVTLTAKPSPPEEPAIACTLDGRSMERRLADWQALIDGEAALTDGVVGRSTVSGGVRVEFGPDVDVTELARLAVAEQGCCRFFSFAITVDGRGVGLEVSAPDEGVDVVRAMFGVPA